MKIKKPFYTEEEVQLPAYRKFKGGGIYIKVIDDDSVLYVSLGTKGGGTIDINYMSDRYFGENYVECNEQEFLEFSDHVKEAINKQVSLINY